MKLTVCDMKSGVVVFECTYPTAKAADEVAQKYIDRGYFTYTRPVLHQPPAPHPQNPHRRVWGFGA